MKTFIHLFIFIYLIYTSHSIVPFWNFETSSINLLSNENQKHEYIVNEQKFHFDLKCIYKRYLENTNGVNITNKLNCEFTDDTFYQLQVIKKEFDFEEIESVYTDKWGYYYIDTLYNWNK